MPYASPNLFKIYEMENNILINSKNNFSNYLLKDTIAGWEIFLMVICKCLISRHFHVGLYITVFSY